MPSHELPIIKPRILILEGLWSDTADAVRAAGGIPIEEHPWDHLAVEEALLSGDYDGMILTGGSDIDPQLYGEKPHHEVYGVDILRDAVELMALNLAQSLQLPVLGICRGSQIMCAFRGGSLTQHIDGHRGTSHWAECTPEGRTFRRACSARDIAVVSLHHQCVRRPGKGMVIAARALDGTPEAIESKDGLWLGCQFHPELNAFDNRRSFAIFRWLVQKSAEYAGGRAPRSPFRGARRRKHGSMDEVYNGYDPSSPSGASQRQRDFAWGTGTSTTTFDVDGTAEVCPVPQATQASPPRKPRKAGEPAIPSMRGYVSEVIEESRRATRPRALLNPGSASSELLVCGSCGMIFDDEDDRDDHEWFVHERHATDDSPPFVGASGRYPELVPPPGHPAYDEDASDDDIATAWMDARGYMLH